MVLTYVDYFLVIHYRKRDPVFALLLECIYFTLCSIYWFILLLLTQYLWAKVVDFLLGAFTLWCAVIFYDRWNNRRKKKKGLKVAGKVGVRLGRLVIIPEV